MATTTKTKTEELKHGTNAERFQAVQNSEALQDIVHIRDLMDGLDRAIHAWLAEGHGDTCKCDYCLLEDTRSSREDGIGPAEVRRQFLSLQRALNAADKLIASSECADKFDIN